MSKHLHGDWTHIPVKHTNTKPTAWLQTPTKHMLRQNPTRGTNTSSLARYQSNHPQNLISIFFRVAKTEDSSSQAWRTLAIILRVNDSLIIIIFIAFVLVIVVVSPRWCCG
jgi:hypothetical protein